MIHRPALTVVTALGLLSCAVAAQQGPERRLAELRDKLVKEVTEQVRSSDLPTVAWGAQAVAEFHLEQCVPELRARLTALAMTDAKQREFAVLAILDTMIQLHVAVPGDKLRPLMHGRCVAPSLVLLGRNVRANRKLLLETFRELGRNSLEWHACGNLLAQVSDPAFALELVRLPIDVNVTVTAPNGEQAPRDHVAASTGFLTSIVTVPAEYPLIAFYSFREGTTIGGPLLAPGPVAVFAGRNVTRSLTDCSSPDDFDEVRREAASAHAAWLAQMLGPKAETGRFAFDRAIDHAWSGGEPYTDAVLKLCGEIENEHRALVGQCVAEKLFAAEAAPPPPPVRLHVDDRRADQSVPLPATPPPAK